MNGFVTDVDYFRKNRNISKFSTLLIFALIVVPSVVYSQPDNEIELPPSNVDFENGLVRKYQVHNGLYKDSFTENFKYYPIRKGKFHKKSLKQKSRKYLDPNKQYFDYYPVEKVDVKYDSKEDDNIKVILLSDLEKLNNNSTQLLDNKIQNENINKKNRSKRDLIKTMKNDKVKRQTNGYDYSPPSNPTFEREYYSQGTPNDPWVNEFNSRLLSTLSKPETKLTKYPIPGNYYNAISPSGLYLSADKPNNSNDPDFIGPRASNPLIWGRIPIRGNNNKDQLSVNNGRQNCNCDESNSNSGTDNQYSIPSQQDRNPSANQPNRNPSSNQKNKNPSPPLIHVAMPTAIRSRIDPTSVDRRFDSDFTVRDRVVWNRYPGRVNSIDQQKQVNNSPLPKANSQNSDRRNRIDNIGFDISESELRPKEPSKCVWAIVSCCARNNAKVRYACFEEIGCHGAFWDINPCADEYQRKAIAEADSYFE